ncbi:hypothetical protein GCM10007418_33310 [Halopseudomonas salina]|uniref:Uncharacterized protein n=1 Tax=Halopseudomonas salina TaxID=1323744 RepID=A0ABQ1Q451_9GAMM|nr:hypothetical protein GCM10007418_33310 [Halopseudomonas salina]
MIETDKGGCRVRAAAAQAAAHGQGLVEADICAQFAAAGLLKKACSADDQVVLGRDAGQGAVKDKAAVCPEPEMQGVASVHELKDSLQCVVAIWSSPGDVQEQIELGWRRQAQLAGK